MKAIIFDLFGTLVDIENPTHPYRRLLSDVNDPDIRHAVMCRDETLSTLSKKLGLGLTPEAIVQGNKDIEDEVQRIFVYPEVSKVLESLNQENVLVIVSSNLARPYRVAKDLLKHQVDYWNFSFNTGRLKPDPEMVLAPAKAFGLSPSDCVVIGDSLASDGGAAKNAGMRFVHIKRKGNAAAGDITTLSEAVSAAKRLT